MAASAVNAFNRPSHQGHLSNKDRIIWWKGVLEGDYCTQSSFQTLQNDNLKDLRYSIKTFLLPILFRPLLDLSIKDDL